MINDTVTELRNLAKATLYKQVRMLIALAESGSEDTQMESTSLDGMIEMARALNLLSLDEINDVIEKAKSDQAE